MKNISKIRRKMAAGLTFAGLLGLAGSASATLVITTNTESGTLDTYPFTPSWTLSPASLIAGVAPIVTANGDFNTEQSGGTARDVNSLTSGGSLAINVMGSPVTTANNYVSAGNGAGKSVIYTLPATATLGYEVTNITVCSGWRDGGRDGQAYNISYSTVANPTAFNFLAAVKYDGPTITGTIPSAIRLMFTDSEGGAIAHNVAQIKIDFSAPDSENGWTGYGAITVDGSPSASTVAPGLITTAETQTGTGVLVPTWVAETGNLLVGIQPVSSAGNFAAETSGGLPVLTDGLIGTSGDSTGFATCGPSAGRTLVYTLANSVNGSDITNIVVYSGWGDRNRDGQAYVITYSTVSAPTTFLPLTTYLLNPDIPTGVSSASRVALRNPSGAPIAQNVSSLKIDFASLPSFDNGYVGISEIVVQGVDSAPPTAPPAPYMTQDTLPASAADVVGSQVAFTAAFSNVPPTTLQWQFISGGVTNDIPGATGETLTLNNLQVTNSGAYRLKAVNATNVFGVSYSSASPLVVTNIPAAVSGVITLCAAQTGLGSAGTETNFYPNWTMAGNSLIANAVPTAGVGNYGLDQTGGDPQLLTDGTFGYLNYWPDVGGSPSLVTCGVSPAGQSVTYTLDTTTAVNGYDLTNIVVYGGWGDAGRDAQKYQVLYATVADPTSFNQLAAVDYNPSNPKGAQSATRVTLRPAESYLAQNVAAVMINFNLQGAPAENGYVGYSEIVVCGTPSAPKPVLAQDIRPLSAADVEGSTLLITAGFTSASPVTYQWKKDGVNIPGANSPTLTLGNLKLTDTATNGGYSLVASNSSGFAVSRGCAVIVNPAPAAVSNVVASFALQTGDAATFSPTWSVIPGSLIAFQTPSATGTGNFNDPAGNPASGGLAGGLPVLTDEGYGSLVVGGEHPAFATCGPSAGRYVVYTLTGSTNGYDLTNIVVAGGWNDSGRDQQAYTVAYSTVRNPTTFIPVAVVNTNPVLAVPANHSLIRTTLTPVAGPLATNVVAVMLDFVTPAGENGYSGYSEISVYGAPSATLPAGPVATVENQNTDAPAWTLETGNLIAGQLPTSVGAGDFQLESSGGLPVLTDGLVSPLTGHGPFATCGSAAGRSVTYTTPYGWNIKQIVVYSGWADAGRDGQFYNIYYSTLTDPATFLPLTSIDYNPDVASGASANRVSITNSTGGFLAAGVAAVKFDFSRQGANDNTYSGYAELVLLGTIAPHLDASYISGNQLILTGGGTPGDTYALLTSTNAAAPLNSWTTNTVGVIDSTGAISQAIPLSTSESSRFFRLKTP